jgi:hypothetical protein
MDETHAHVEFARRSSHWRASKNTIELHLSRLIGTASYPDMQKIRISRFFFENTPHWQFAVQLLLFTVCTAV